MRCLLPAALTAALALPVAGAARDLAVTLDWVATLDQPKEIAAVLLDSTGQILAAQHLPVVPGESSASLVFSPLPRQVTHVQAGLVEQGQMRAQTARLELEPGQSDITATLEPLLALGFRARWLCADDTRIDLAPDGDGLRMTAPAPMRLFSPAAGDDVSAPLVADDGARLHDHGARLMLQLPDQPETECAPVPFPPVLPVTARAESEQGWQIDLTLAGAILDIPALPHDPDTKVALLARRDGDGRLTFEGESLTLQLVDQQCRFRTAAVPYPITAHLTLSPEVPPSIGCAGNPLSLLRGGSWLVTSLFNLAVDPTQPDMPELTLAFASDQITGRAACNRYVGTATIVEEMLQISDLGTTRLACPVALQNLELRFLDALEQATGFDLDGPDRLILRAGPVSVMTARRR
ncbi:MAG: META domain-containing protein [Rhodobacteraceae bacterium]|nr:META domain-containing protein [Paracoccaceae bacterium]